MTEGRDRIHEQDREAPPAHGARPGGGGAMGDPDERATEVRREAVEGSSRPPDERRRPGLDPENAEWERRKRMDEDGTPGRSATAHDRELTPEELPDPGEATQG